MIIYVEGGNENRPALKKLSDELYGRLYASRGINNFYYGFTPYTVGYEKEYCSITFEDKLDQGTRALLVFIEIVESRFEIIRIDDEDEDKEKEAIAEWEKDHTQKPLPKKVGLPIIIIRAPTNKDPFEEITNGLYGKINKYRLKDESERLIITNKYTSEGAAEARTKFHEVSLEEYKKICADFGAPENPEDAL